MPIIHTSTLKFHLSVNFEKENLITKYSRLRKDVI